MLSVTPAHCQTAAFPVTSDHSCHVEVREVHVVVVMTGIEAVGREDEEEEEKQTEEGGKFNNCYFTHFSSGHCYFHCITVLEEGLLLYYWRRGILWMTFNLFSQKHGRFQCSWWKEEERWQCWSGFPWPQQRSQEAEQSSSFPQAASLRAPGSLHQFPGLAWWDTGGPQLGRLSHCGNMPGHHQVLPEAHLCPRPLHCAPRACKLYFFVSLSNSRYCIVICTVSRQLLRTMKNILCSFLFQHSITITSNFKCRLTAVV